MQEVTSGAAARGGGGKGDQHTFTIIRTDDAAQPGRPRRPSQGKDAACSAQIVVTAAGNAADENGDNDRNRQDNEKKETKDDGSNDPRCEYKRSCVVRGT